MHLKPTRILLLSAILGIAGCASNLAWQRPDTSQMQASRDQQECRRLARDESWRLGWEDTWPPRFYDPAFMPPFYAYRRPFWRYFPNSAETEYALADFCMHSKHYRIESYGD